MKKFSSLCGCVRQQRPGSKETRGGKKPTKLSVNETGSREAACGDEEQRRSSTDEGGSREAACGDQEGRRSSADDGPHPVAVDISGSHVESVKTKHFEGPTTITKVVTKDYLSAAKTEEYESEIARLKDKLQKKGEKCRKLKEDNKQMELEKERLEAILSDRDELLQARRREKKELEKDQKLSRSWEEFMDRMEHVGLADVDHQLLLKEFSRFSDEVDSGMTVEEFLTFLRWRHDLRDYLRDSLTAIGKEEIWRKAEENFESSDGGTVIFRTCGLSTTRNMPRLCLAFRKMDLMTLPFSSVETLCYLGCMSPSKCHLSLSEVSVCGNENLARCFLRRKHRGMHSLLLEKYLKVDVAEIAEEFSFQKPHLPKTYVNREDHEHFIEEWLYRDITSTQKTPLYLFGMGSVGKTCLANQSAINALSLGFHRVYWLKPGTKELDTKDQTVIKQKLAIGDKILIIPDDLEDKKLLDTLPTGVSVLVTTREVSKTGIDKDYREIVGFADPSESETLTLKILGEEIFGKLSKKTEMWNRVLKLFEDEFQMPLTINILATILYTDRDEWNHREVKYVDELIEMLTDAKKKMEAKLPRSDETSYEYAHVCAAIYVSIKRLNKEDRKRYKQLCIFDESSIILPVTMSKMWNIGKKEADVKLKEFVNRSILSNLGYDDATEQYRFSLHKLLSDVLQADEKRCERIKEGIGKYCRSSSVDDVDFDNIDKHDLFFFGDFVRVCLSIERHGISAACLTSLSYLVTRVSLHLSADLLDDFDKTLQSCPKNRALEQYKEIVKSALSSAVKRDDADILLRASLARRDLVDVFSDARVLVTNEGYRDGTFLTVDNVLIAPLLSYKTKSSDDLDVDKDVSVSDVRLDKENRRLLIRYSEKALLIDCEAKHEKDKTFSCPLVFISFLRKSSNAVAVTETDVLYATDGQSFCSKITVNLPVGCKYVGADLKEDILWVLVANQDDANTVSCYLQSFSVSDKLQLMKEVSCKVCRPARVILSECGKSVCVAPLGHERRLAEVFHLDESRVARSLDVSGHVVGFIREGTLLCLMQQKSQELIIRVVDVIGNSEDWVRRVTEPEPFAFCHGDAVIILNRQTGICKRLYFGSEESDVLTLTNWPDGPVTMSAHEGKLIVCGGWHSKIVVFSLAELFSHFKAGMLSNRSQIIQGSQKLQKPVLRWMDGLKEIVMVSIEQKSTLQLIVRSLHSRQVILSVDLPSSFPDNFVISHSLSSFSKRCVAVAFGTTVWNWTVEDGAESSESVPEDHRILHICHSDSEGHLYLLLRHTTTENADDEERLDEVILWKFLHGRIAKLTDLSVTHSFSQMYVLDSPQSVILWSKAMKRCFVLSFTGESQFTAEKVDFFAVSHDHCRFLLLTASSKEENQSSEDEVFVLNPYWNITVWDVPSKSSLYSQESGRVLTAAFSSLNSKVAFLSQDRRPMIRNARLLSRLSSPSSASSADLTCLRAAISSHNIGGTVFTVSKAPEETEWVVEQQFYMHDAEGKLLAFAEDEKSLLFRQKCLIVSVRLEDSKESLMWDWRWTDAWQSHEASAVEQDCERTSTLELCDVETLGDSRGTSFAVISWMGNTFLLKKISTSSCR